MVYPPLEGGSKFLQGISGWGIEGWMDRGMAKLVRDLYTSLAVQLVKYISPQNI
jgi:hypothetical protein